MKLIIVKIVIDLMIIALATCEVYIYAINKNMTTLLIWYFTTAIWSIILGMNIMNLRYV